MSFFHFFLLPSILFFYCFEQKDINLYLQGVVKLSIISYFGLPYNFFLADQFFFNATTIFVLKKCVLACFQDNYFI